MKIFFPRIELTPEYWTMSNIITLKTNILGLSTSYDHCWAIMKEAGLSKNHSGLPGP